MAGNFACSNTACPNVNRGMHITARAARECRQGVRAARVNVPEPGMPQPMSSGRYSLDQLSALDAESTLTEDDILQLPEFSRLGDDGRDILLDLIAAEGGHAPGSRGGEGLVTYIDEAFTGFNSLTAWAEADMADDRDEEHLGQSTENYAELALQDRIWLLPRRDDASQYRVMSRNAAL